MTPTVDVDRLLETVLEDGGPQDMPASFLDAALAKAAGIGQRRVLPLVDDRAWPSRYRVGAGSPVRLAVLGFSALLIIAMLAALFAGSRIVRPTKPGILRTLDGVVERVGRLTAARDDPTLVALADGRVLIIGGAEAGMPAELFDPKTGTAKRVGTDEPDGPITAVRLNDDRVLILGWTYGEPAATGRSDLRLFDPSTDSFSPAGPLLESRFEPNALLLRDGRVL